MGYRVACSCGAVSEAPAETIGTSPTTGRGCECYCLACCGRGRAIGEACCQCGAGGGEPPCAERMDLPAGKTMPAVRDVSIIPENETLNINNTPRGGFRRSYAVLLAVHVNLCVDFVHRVGIRACTVGCEDGVTGVECYVAYVGKDTSTLIITDKPNLHAMDLDECWQNCTIGQSDGAWWTRGSPRVGPGCRRRVGSRRFRAFQRQRSATIVRTRVRLRLLWVRNTPNELLKSQNHSIAG